MRLRWGTELKVFFGLLLILLATVLSGWFTITAMRQVEAANNRVIELHGRALIDAERLRYFLEQEISSGRAYFFGGDRATFYPEILAARQRFDDVLAKLRAQSAPGFEEGPAPLSVAPEKAGLLDEISRLEDEQERLMERAYALRARNASSLAILDYLRREAAPVRSALHAAVDRLVAFEEFHMRGARAIADRTEGRIERTLFMIDALLVLLIVGAASFILRLIRRSKRLHDETARAVRLREEVLAVVSHDLKNPLSSIDLSSQLLRRSAAPDSRKIGENIARSVGSMTALIRDLLDYSKIESGRIRVQKSAEELGGIFEDLRGVFGPLAEQKGVRLAMDRPDGALAVPCERERMLQILSNLLGNALKFTPEGGEIGVRVATEPGGAVFSVWDTGPGIRPEQLPRVFDRYWQASETAKLGTGLGLAIVKGLVEAHGGSVWAESRLGEGSRFHVRLPLEQAPGLKSPGTPLDGARDWRKIEG